MRDIAVLGFAHEPAAGGSIRAVEAISETTGLQATVIGTALNEDSEARQRAAREGEAA